MTANLCPQCGKPLPSDGPQGQCPACLLKAALPGQSAVTSSETGMHDSTAESGTRLKYFGDYELLEEIARGGMGVVWKARQTSLKRDVAVKMIRAGALAGPEEVKRFLREAEAAANLQHPNIVAIHEVGEHGGQHYFSMDYVAGRDLGAIVKDGPLSSRVAARYVKIIAEAIHFAHQRGTLHRDLKPQNVLIDSNDQPRITDFGLAKIMKDDSRLTQSGVVMGSPSYMPPEQAAGRQEDVGPASDVYSLGAMLYELLTGQPPFRGATCMATLRDVMENEPAEPRRLKSDIPPDLETICLKCLEKSPTLRYPTARALAEELDRFLNGEPILARPASSVRKMVSWARCHPGILAALAAWVIVALAFGVFYMFEENAFLQAKLENRALERKQGPLHESLILWTLINFWVMYVSFFIAFFYLVLAATGLPREQGKQAIRERWGQPLGERMRTFALCAGMIQIGCGGMLLVTAIQAYVWEGQSFLNLDLVWVYTSILSGLATFERVIRDYRVIQHGIPRVSENALTVEQIASIRAVLEKDWDVETAVKLYREALPGAGWEAFMFVGDVMQQLKAQQPDKFDPPLALVNLNWKALLKCALIDAVILGVMWFLNPPSHPTAAVSLFACSFLFGLALQAQTRLKGWWKRILVFVPALLVIVLSEALLRSTEGSWRTAWPYLLGFFCGSMVTIAGLSGEASRAMRKKLGSA